MDPNALIPDWLDDVQDMACVVDKDLHIVASNRAFSVPRGMFGEIGSVRRKRLEEAFPLVSEASLEGYRRIFKSGRPVIGPEDGFFDGPEPAETTRIPLYGEDGVELLVIVIREARSREFGVRDSKVDGRTPYSELRTSSVGNSLPTSNLQPPASNLQPPTSNPVRKVLLVDDEPMVLDMTKAMLNHLGYDVSCAEDGGIGLDLYRRSRFDAVILDLTIKGGAGAVETIRELLRFDPAARAIVSTGYTSDPVVDEYKTHGFVGVVRKPYNIEDLENALGSALTRSAL